MLTSAFHAVEWRSVSLRLHPCARKLEALPCVFDWLGIYSGLVDHHVRDFCSLVLGVFDQPSPGTDGVLISSCSGTSLFAITLSGIISDRVPSYAASQWQIYLIYVGTALVTSKLSLAISIPFTMLR